MTNTNTGRDDALVGEVMDELMWMKRGDQSAAEACMSIIALVRADERERIAAALLGNDNFPFYVVDEVIGRIEPSGSLQISPSEWKATYEAPGAQDAIKSITDDFIREAIGITEEMA